MTTAAEFTGLPFVAGSVRGVRSWDVDQLGRLVSPSYRHIWTPGENEATCQKGSGQRLFLSFAIEDDNLRRALGMPPKATSPASKPVATEAHSQAKCACGFYAYSNGMNDYADSSRITGVIQGYGETQLGTRGFKCSKAQVLALFVPSKVKAPKRRQVTPDGARFDRVRELYRASGVSIYDDYAQMLADFPAYQHEHSPDTDPDFWTRSVS